MVTYCRRSATPSVECLLVEIRLRVGATLAQTIDALRDRAQALQGVLGAGHSLDAYLDWVDETHRQLGNCLLPRQVEKLVETPRYWAVQRMEHLAQAEAWVNQLITREVDSQRRVLEELLTELEGTQVRWQRGTGLIVMPDTNILLHHRHAFQDIVWPEALAWRGDVNLVIPLVVVTELDRHKRSTNTKVRTRARVTLRTLNELLPETSSYAPPTSTAAGPPWSSSLTPWTTSGSPNPTARSSTGRCTSLSSAVDRSALQRSTRECGCSPRRTGCGHSSCPTARTRPALVSKG